jgi:DNA-binding NarL/FixJ family response regulator
MSDRHFKIILVDPDPIFRLGLRVALEAMPNIEVVSEAATDTAVLQTLAELAQQDPNQVNLVILELGDNRSTDSQQQGLQLIQQLKALYPTLPILLFSSVQTPGIIMAAKAFGADGYCPKGTPVAELVTAMVEVANGNSYWLETRTSIELNPLPQTPARRLPLAKWRYNLHSSGIGYIDATLKEITAQLQIPGLPILDRAILAGQRRELLAARWLVNQLLLAPQEQPQQPPEVIPSIQPPLSVLPSPGSNIFTSEVQTIFTTPPLLSPRSLQSTLFASCINKLQFSLNNVSDTPLEIDIFREDRKRELLYLILQKLSEQLDDLREAQITVNQLIELQPIILKDLWQATVTEFFGKFSIIKLGNRNIEIVNVLLQNSVVVQTAILNKIPLVRELLSYLLFQTDLQIDNTSYPAGTSEANFQAEIMLENLLIQVANAVVQPLLNSLADVEQIKKDFYDRKLISTREIERFRNDLSWKYRLNNYVKEAQAIFESRYELFLFAPRGIARISVYAPRNEELAQLAGIPLLVTLTLEFRDAIAPRLQSVLSFLGSGIVFVLTQIIGRGLGLIGRGVIQGIGSVSFSEKNFKRNNERSK